MHNLRYIVPLITYTTVNIPNGTTTGFLYHDSDNNKWLLTARHNLYPLPHKIKKLPSDEPYDEILIQKLVLKFKRDGTHSRERELTQNDLLEYARISAQQEVDIAAINLAELLETASEYKEYLLSKSFFTAKNLSERYCDYDTGNPVNVLGFRSDCNLNDKASRFEYPGKIMPITEKDVASSKYRKFLFAVDAIPPLGVSGGPVILDGSYNTNYSEILLGICSGYNHETKKGIITFADTINDIVLHGIRLHKEKWRSS
jgi:hypothetical protein